MATNWPTIWNGFARLDECAALDALRKFRRRALEGNTVEDPAPGETSHESRE